LNEEKPPVQGQGQGINTHGPGIERHLAQMIAFASLDSVDELLEGTGNLYVLLAPTLHLCFLYSQVTLSSFIRDQDWRCYV
jgi:hypothetical protein